MLAVGTPLCPRHHAGYGAAPLSLPPPQCRYGTPWRCHPLCHLCCAPPQYGFNLVMSHPHAVNEIALSLNNKNPRWVGDLGSHMGGGWGPTWVGFGVPHGSDLGSHMVRVGVPHGWDLGSHMVGVGVRYGWDLGYHEDEIWGVLWEGIGVLHR